MSTESLGESEYENLLQTFVREQKSAILTDDDLCVIKNKINMGRKNGTVSNSFQNLPTKFTLLKIAEPSAWYAFLRQGMIFKQTTI